MRPFRVEVPDAAIAVSKDELLDNLMLYWLPAAGASAARLDWNELDKGGHFAALEQPETFTAEVRAAFRAFR